MAIEFTCPECAEKNTVGPEFAGRRGTCAFCGAQVIVPQASGMAQAVATMLAAPGLPRQNRSGHALDYPSSPLSSPSCCSAAAYWPGSCFLPSMPLREAGRRASCLNKMHQLGLAMANYQSTYGHYPPAVGGTKGNPVSWRVALLPFMEYDYLYKQYHQDEPWNSPCNNSRHRQAKR